MAILSFSNLDQLKKYLEIQIKDTLKTDVATSVEADFADSAENIVYNAYPEPKYPVEYQRQYSLMQPETYDVEDEDKTSISITVNHPHGELIEYGHGEGGYYPHPYNRYDTAYLFMQPRPFFRLAVEALKDGSYKEYLLNGLKQRGINVH